MFGNLTDALEFIEKHEIQMIDLKFVDLWGQWHHLTLPVSQFNQDFIDKGVGFDASNFGFKRIQSSDMVVVPDLQTGSIDPFWEASTLSFIGKVLDTETYCIFSHDPRNIVYRAEKWMIDQGIADYSLWGPEFEFYIFDKI